MTLNGRMTVTAAVAVVLTTTALYPIFTDSLFFAESLGAILVVAAIGALTRLRSVPVLACLGASLIGLVLYLNLVFEHPHSLLFVIPTTASISRLWDLVGSGLSDARTVPPPVQNLPGLLFLTVGGVGITALLTDLIAVRLRSTALAGLPLLVLFTVPVMVNAPHSQLAEPLVFCVAGAGYLAMLSADGRERIRVWGRLVSLWRSGSRPDKTGSNGAGSNGAGISGAHVRSSGYGPDTRALAAAGRRVGLASIVLALFAPLLVPGLHPSKVFSSGVVGSGGAGVPTLPNALTQAIAEMEEKRPAVQFTYTTSASLSMQKNGLPYLRQYVYDTLTDNDGYGWANYGNNAGPISLPDSPQGLLSLAWPMVTTNVTMAADSSLPTFLPLNYPVSQLTVQGKWLADPELMVYSGSDGTSIAGHSYTETSFVVDPSTAQLEQLGELTSTSTSSLGPDLEVPASYKTTALEKLAQQYTAGQSTEFGKVNALADWLSGQSPGSSFSYSLKAATFKTAGGLLSFLTKSKTGFCVQYAYAMTTLTRLLGIPARFVVGYTAGTKVKGNEYEVKNTDAHAWTEVYFPDYGWLWFDATPGGEDGSAHPPPYMTPSSGTLGGNPGDPIIHATAPATQPKSGHRTNLGRGGTNPGGSAVPGNLSGKSGGTPWAALVLAVIAAIALACGVIAMVAPPAQRTLAHSPGPARRRRPVSATSAVLVAVAAALIALALYRLLSGTSGLRLDVGWAVVGIAFGAAAAVALIAPSVIRLALRRWRWMRADDDASRAHVAWREFRDDLTDFGVGCRASDPPRTLAGRVTTGLPEPAREAIRRLALAEERASYAACPSDSEHLQRDGSIARRGLAVSAGRGARWRARVFPVSLVSALEGAAAGVLDFLATRVSRRRPEHRSAS
jgi:transglutaminase-like putative cysteine protease